MKSEQYMEDIEQTRTGIDRTLLSLEEKLSPRRLFARVVKWVGGATEFSIIVGRTVRDNPIPATLMAISLLWLWVAGASREKSSRSLAATREQINRQMQEIDLRLRL